ncbi:LacI family DNA-binding transcriptional regulator [Psychromarinibacter sp. C21-152]|uniref:LacI family DNA-binding transcriptional regulator n=1 Tax=Psychromarinibacter sediminicola TaxID=3033385 RepID=A0AAE3NP83_9RHOB|nr:LacI family DNA-binding transcriptional regulator [Psychromarinibacter sediminicola]MDF0599114.1 LacI family DNA-binding transcriptional regulator [Psychromarinibacter sediminicola]
MGNDHVTSLQVARRAGVSQSAVSRVFTPGASVSGKTREKVLAAAEELGYRPNVLARAMITGKSRIIGLVVAYLENQFYPEAVERLSVALQQKGYHVLVFMASPTKGDVQDVMREILDYQVDGIILASVSMSSVLARRCHEHGIPVLLFNRAQDDDRMSSVTTDNYQGGRAIAAHIASLGHTRIGYIAGLEEASTQRDRERGFREGLEEAGLSLAARELGNFEYARARVAALEMFAGPARPEAVFVCNDHMAFAVMDVIRSKLGLRIPEDVAVAAFDDTPIAAWPAYDLTSYRQPINRMVAQTVDALLQRIEDRDAPARRVVLEGELIIRGSTTPRQEG